MLALIGSEGGACVGTGVGGTGVGGTGVGGTGVGGTRVGVSAGASTFVVGVASEPGVGVVALVAEAPAVAESVLLAEAEADPFAVALALTVALAVVGDTLAEAVTAAFVTDAFESPPPPHALKTPAAIIHPLSSAPARASRPICSPVIPASS
jgi:hypothetical protein